MTSMNPETGQHTRSMQSPMPTAMNPATSTPTRRNSSWQDARPDWLSTETIAYVLTVFAVIIACAAVGDGAGADDRDYFTADKAFLYITLLTMGYMISRGLAKIGGRPHSDI